MPKKGKKKIKKKIAKKAKEKTLIQKSAKQNLYRPNVFKSTDSFSSFLPQQALIGHLGIVNRTYVLYFKSIIRGVCRDDKQQI